MVTMKERLQACGLTEERVAATFGPVPTREAAAAHLRRARDDGSSALIRLLVLGEEVRALELPVPAADLEVAGLAERDGDRVRTGLRVTPYAGLLLAHDPDQRVHDSDYVTGVNNASRTLAALTIRTPAVRALDLGTGCGVQALLAARHAEATVAVDVSERAVRYARLNCRLNNSAVEVRRGSWFEPVNGETFDLIVANPPFVISPDSSYVFRDSGLAGDAVSRDVVRGAAAHLRQGGHATVLCNWICRSQDETWQPLAEWVDGTGCDALLLAHQPVEPFVYAARWNEPLRGDAKAYAQAIQRWLDYYEREGVAAIGIGAVVLRRRDGDNSCRGFDLSLPASDEAGNHLLRLLAALDELPADDRSLLRGSFRLVDGHRLDQRLRYEHGAYTAADIQMSADDNVGLVAHIDATTLPLLFALDPGRPLQDAVADAGADPDEAVRLIRRLYQLGLVQRT
jgi:methylase of polypeptide subunit release factors